ncbi:MAG TPA: RNA polymerase sigma factor [Candidatus Limnocylindrales bacterium]
MAEANLEATANRDDVIRDRLLAWSRDARALATWMLRDADSGDDAVQEAVLLGWEKRRTLRNPEQVEAWLNQILVNVCRGELRRRSRQNVRLAPVETLAGHDNASAQRDEIATAMGCLEPDEQIVVALRFGRDLSIPQIAAQTGLREGTVKSRLHYALEHLRAALAVQQKAVEADR